MAAETNPEWGVPHVVPNILGNQAGAAAWSDAATIIPWTIYKVYGDKAVSYTHLDVYKRQVERCLPLSKLKAIFSRLFERSTEVLAL